MNKTTRDHLEDLQHEARLVAQFTREGKEAFLRDERTQYAVMMAYVRIGEIAKQIPMRRCWHMNGVSSKVSGMC